MSWEGLSPPYRTLVIDPPWPITWSSGESYSSRRGNKAKLSYSTMTVEQIAALPISDLIDGDAHLYLWVTARHFREGIGAQVARAWGFQPHGEIVWRKPGIGLGTFPRLAHEYLLIAVRGTLPFDGPRDIASVQDWPYTYARSGNSVARVHSAKPAAALDLIERQSPPPRVELFSRQPRMGWDSWGWGYEQVAPPAWLPRP
jgi:N6-adenosine-specific RNA methylase IME4